MPDHVLAGGLSARSGSDRRGGVADAATRTVASAPSWASVEGRTGFHFEKVEADLTSGRVPCHGSSRFQRCMLAPPETTGVPRPPPSPAPPPDQSEELSWHTHRRPSQGARRSQPGKTSSTVGGGRTSCSLSIDATIRTLFIGTNGDGAFRSPTEVTTVLIDGPGTTVWAVLARPGGASSMREPAAGASARAPTARHLCAWVSRSA